LFEEVQVTDLLVQVRPHIYAKGGDYTIESIDQHLRSALETHGIEVRFLSCFQGVSTTKILAGLDDESRAKLAHEV
jgi:bifunctional ADP-heptose synthase (sugar kinase/adenylyltransferase)